MIIYRFNKSNVTLQHWLLYHMIRHHTKIWLDERHDNMCLYNAYSITLMLWIRSHAHTHTNTHTNAHTHTPYNIYERVLDRYSHMHIHLNLPGVFQLFAGLCLAKRCPRFGGAFWPGRYMSFRSPEQLRMAGKVQSPNRNAWYLGSMKPLSWRWARNP